MTRPILQAAATTLCAISAPLAGAAAQNAAPQAKPALVADQQHLEVQLAAQFKSGTFVRLNSPEDRNQAVNGAQMFFIPTGSKIAYQQEDSGGYTSLEKGKIDTFILHVNGGDCVISGEPGKRPAIEIDGKATRGQLASREQLQTDIQSGNIRAEMLPATDRAGVDLRDPASNRTYALRFPLYPAADGDRARESRVFVVENGAVQRTAKVQDLSTTSNYPEIVKTDVGQFSFRNLDVTTGSAQPFLNSQPLQMVAPQDVSGVAPIRHTGPGINGCTYNGRSVNVADLAFH